MKIVEAVRGSFNKIPSPVKVILYSGVSVALGTLATDIEAMPEMYGKYLVIPVTVGINLITYLLLREKN